MAGDSSTVGPRANAPQQAGQEFPMHAAIIPMVWDIALNTAIPLLCYHLSKAYISPSDLTALIAASVFPVLKSLFGMIRRGQLDPIAILVLLGIAVSSIAILFGGSPKLLLLRESFFTAAFGLACLVSLALPRPLMFYFARFFTAGNDPVRKARIDASYQYPEIRRGHRIITLGWAVLMLGEFVARVAMIYTLPVSTVLAVSPFLIGSATILGIVLSIRYGRKMREQFLRLQAAASAPEPLP